jgi:hypothetical protein
MAAFSDLVPTARVAEQITIVELTLRVNEVSASQNT